MRIENQKIFHLERLIEQMGLKVDDFEVNREDDFLNYKYSYDYFFFSIKRLDENRYRVEKTTIRNKQKESVNTDWQHMFQWFKTWVAEISTDEKHKPKYLASYDQMFPDEIKSISQKFIVIYYQALSAERKGLDEICGLGYRKAFEFLIKDYAISKSNPQEHEKIVKISLSACIENYTDNEKIKSIAKRTAWLANDHAHYYKRWLDKDLADLKRLINLSIDWIVADERKKEIDSKISQVVQDMPDKRSSKESE